MSCDLAQGMVEESSRHGYQRNMGGIATRGRYEMTVDALQTGSDERWLIHYQQP